MATRQTPPAKDKPPARRWLQRLGRWLRNLLIVLAVAPPIQVALLRWVDPPLTHTMLMRAWRHSRTSGEWRLPDRRWVDIGTLPTAVPVAVLSSEDRGFFSHHGFDWKSIRWAWHRYRTRPNAKLIGGSTLSQQVSRNVFLTQHRSWLRKGLEAWYTVWLELLVPKQRIVEVYLNVAEMGPMVFGIEAAAQHWYRKPAARLKPLEAAAIVALLPSPNRWRPDSGSAKRRAKWLVAHPVAWPAAAARRR